ncbi:phenylalanine--tRNA ligase subunit alpha [Candidatus Symbiobacter mobilis]|uniref:Phenylalanine--tRNA ligase alpha subunit n=1 Tax=Candidatus Symbiobacter mobilis CR TaxID=946483 RepID=U5N4Q5_9BURK|nr:phenylalanine--tRNA ligase subunit alpha [Candidatus Symbiobacter mobilis]AGX86250.1 phenylalanyl-tRNA synthetase subunit alpha [Candidatus Symbiobacter mobilis CR]
MDALQAIVEEARQAFAQARTAAEVENVKAAYLGKSGQITLCMQGLGALPLEERKRRGATINEAKRAIEQCLQDRRQALAQQALYERLRVEALDVTLPGRTRTPGGLHPVSLTIERIEAYFSTLGFEVAQGPEIETDWFNFTALNTPPDHPARSMHDTFYVEGGADTLPCLLRTHTSPIQIRHAMQHVRRYARPHGNTPSDSSADSPPDSPSPTPPDALYSGPMPDIRVIAPGRTYRVDSDATHSPMFHQCEGLWIGDSVSFKDLRYTFTHFCRTFFESEDVALRFRPSFFPFTEPSAEVDIRFADGPLAGRWLEVAGAGQVHPNVVRNMGLDPERYIGFAFGMGPDRLTMLRYGINDLRMFFDADLRFLSQFR